MIYIYDLEIYPNLFVGLFKLPENKEIKTFTIWYHNDKYMIDDRKELLLFLKSNPKLIGFNNINYDSQLLEFIIHTPNFSMEDLKLKSDEAIQSKWPLIPEWKLSTNQLDLYKIWHYDNNSRRTSLKWLEFMFKMRSIKDLPYPINKTIISQRQVDAVVSYCKHDLVPTEEFFNKSKSRIIHRQSITKKFGINVMNKSDSSIGETIILNAVSSSLNIPIRNLKKMRTQRDKIIIKDIIFDYYSNSPIMDSVKDNYFEPLVLHSTVNPETGNKIFDFKKVEDYKIKWQNMEVVYGMGGIHGCVPKGVYESTDKMIIKSCDVVSEYPNIITNNNIYPSHLGPEFTSIYKNKIVNERRKWPKKSHYMLNQMYKLSANSAYGKFNSEFSGLYDPLCSATIVVNGQLSKTLLGEMLTKSIPESNLLMMNTDGLEIIIPIKYQNLYQKICSEWENKTKLKLEHINYKKIIIDGVNNYIGIYENNEVKRKGKFCTWEDLLEMDDYHKNGSAMIIPEAINKYFCNHISPDDTVTKCVDIYKFCYGVKKRSNFNHAILIADNERRIKIKKNSDRVLRFYVAKEVNTDKYKSGILCKLWNDGRLTTINKESTIIPLQCIRSLNITKYPNINRQWYIDEAYKIINDIENMKEL